MTRSGGLAGLRQTASADEADLSPGERDELRRLVQGARFFSLPARLLAARPAPDRFRYRIAVRDGRRRREVIAEEEALTEELRELVRFLERRSGPTRR
ncbi:MAG TPA: protealysin inhibitor emfourin [Anaeromyxobacter sp.]|nr:protealysin inhibitor emfourin [Anaeromyxobacter sp.]